MGVGVGGGSCRKGGGWKSSRPLGFGRLRFNLEYFERGLDLMGVEVGWREL